MRSLQKKDDRNSQWTLCKQIGLATLGTAGSFITQLRLDIGYHLTGAVTVGCRAAAARIRGCRLFTADDDTKVVSAGASGGDAVRGMLSSIDYQRTASQPENHIRAVVPRIRPGSSPHWGRIPNCLEARSTNKICISSDLTPILVVCRI